MTGNTFLRFAVGLTVGIVVTRHLIVLPISQVLFEGFDSRENAAIADEFGAGSNNGGLFNFQERNL